MGYKPWRITIAHQHGRITGRTQKRDMVWFGIHRYVSVQQPAFCESQPHHCYQNRTKRQLHPQSCLPAYKIILWRGGNLINNKKKIFLLHVVSSCTASCFHTSNIEKYQTAACSKPCLYLPHGINYIISP